MKQKHLRQIFWETDHKNRFAILAKYISRYHRSTVEKLLRDKINNNVVEMKCD